MLSNKAQLRSIVNDGTRDREGLFFCDQDAPLPIVKEMLFQFQKYIGQIEDHAAKMKAEQEAQNQPVEEIKPAE